MKIKSIAIISVLAMIISMFGIPGIFEFTANAQSYEVGSYVYDGNVITIEGNELSEGVNEITLTAVKITDRQDVIKEFIGALYKDKRLMQVDVKPTNIGSNGSASTKLELEIDEGEDPADYHVKLMCWGDTSTIVPYAPPTELPRPSASDDYSFAGSIDFTGASDGPGAASGSTWGKLGEAATAGGYTLTGDASAFSIVRSPGGLSGGSVYSAVATPLRTAWGITSIAGKSQCELEVYIEFYTQGTNVGVTVGPQSGTASDFNGSNFVINANTVRDNEWQFLKANITVSDVDAAQGLRFFLNGTTTQGGYIRSIHVFMKDQNTEPTEPTEPTDKPEPGEVMGDGSTYLGRVDFSGANIGSGNSSLDSASYVGGFARTGTLSSGIIASPLADNINCWYSTNSSDRFRMTWNNVSQITAKDTLKLRMVFEVYSDSNYTGTLSIAAQPDANNGFATTSISNSDLKSAGWKEVSKDITITRTSSTIVGLQFYPSVGSGSAAGKIYIRNIDFYLLTD